MPSEVVAAGKGRGGCAAKLHETIVRYTEIARALGPEGVRARMLADGLKKLNAGLRVVAEVSGWPLTVVAENGGDNHR